MPEQGVFFRLGADDELEIIDPEAPFFSFLSSTFLFGLLDDRFSTEDNRDDGDVFDEGDKHGEPNGGVVPGRFRILYLDEERPGLSSYDLFGGNPPAPFAVGYFSGPVDSLGSDELEELERRLREELERINSGAAIGPADGEGG